MVRFSFHADRPVTNTDVRTRGGISLKCVLCLFRGCPADNVTNFLYLVVGRQCVLFVHPASLLNPTLVLASLMLLAPLGGQIARAHPQSAGKRADWLQVLVRLRESEASPPLAKRGGGGEP
jgi:hypothetical protein